MSTVFGVYHRSKKGVENSTIQAIDKALGYWQADEIGKWSEGSLFLGHRMLWNTPESKIEHLPNATQEGNQTYVITSDARLDNRETLAKQLGMAHLTLQRVTDSDLILAAYRKWGEACPEYLLGDFIFVIWDAGKEQLFCVRDHIGIKPFYYHLCDDLFVFSNDIRGVIAHPEVSEKYNKRSIAMFLARDFGFYDEKETFFEAIQKLPAATSMAITKEHVAESVYWTINIPEVHYDTYEAYVEKLRELLQDAVKVRLRTVYPVASHLSGGLDSSAISVLAARELKKRNQPLYAFNWAETPEIECPPDLPERSYAIQIAGLENIEQKDINLTAKFVAEMFDKVDISKEDISFYWKEYLARNEAEKYGVRTFLSGWGGDELISNDGYAYLSGLFWQGHFMKAIKEIAILYKDKNYKYLRILKRSVKELIYPLFYKRMTGLYKKEKSDYNPFVFIRDPFLTSAREFSFPRLDFYPGAHNEQKALYAQGHIQQRIENWASSAFEKKLEYSYPLLDKRIVEFALAIPEDLYARREGHERFFFRSVISEFLPRRIAWKEKFFEIEQAKQMAEMWDVIYRLWLQKNKKILKSSNSYVDSTKIIERIEMYLANKQKGQEDVLDGNAILSILVSNLKNKGC